MFLDVFSRFRGRDLGRDVVFLILLEKRCRTAGSRALGAKRRCRFRHVAKKCERVAPRKATEGRFTEAKTEGVIK